MHQSTFEPNVPDMHLVLFVQPVANFSCSQNLYFAASRRIVSQVPRLVALSRAAACLASYPGSWWAERQTRAGCSQTVPSNHAQHS